MEKEKPGKEAAPAPKLTRNLSVPERTDLTGSNPMKMFVILQKLLTGKSDNLRIWQYTAQECPPAIIIVD